MSLPIRICVRRATGFAGELCRELRKGFATRALMGLRALALMGLAGALALPQPALAYSYASPTSDPLIVGRGAYLKAVEAKDWAAAKATYATFAPDIAALESADGSFKGDPGLAQAFEAALSAGDQKAARLALTRAYVDQIDRRLSGAEAALSNFQTAKILVVAAQAFYTAMAGDLPASTTQTLSAAFQKALDAVGQPGVFGYGQKPADPSAFKAAQETILSTLRPLLSAHLHGASSARAG